MTLPSVLLDTHVLLWILAHSPRVKGVKWLKNYSYWVLSPVSLLEMKFLQECGRIDIEFPEILAKIKKDKRFVIDNIPFDELCMIALEVNWTRDPFDRFLVAHSILQSLPLGTLDPHIRKNYSGII